MNGKRTNRAAVLFLVLLHFSAVAAGFFAPYTPAEQMRDFPWAPPMRIHFLDATSGLPTRPFVYSWHLQSGSYTQYEEDHSRAYPLRLFPRRSSYSLAGLFSCNIHLVDVDAPGKLFLLGTDGYGRDEFSRLLFGARISLFAGILATSIALGLGVLVGGLAGYSGRFADEFLMRLSEIFLAVPWLYLLLAVRAFLPLHLSPAGAFLLLITVIGAVGWARPARLIRGIVLSVKERNFVLAARGFGGSGWYLLRRHILPQTSGVVLTQAGLLIPQFILAEVTLSFLGLGVGEPVPSWGSLLAQLQHYDVLIRSWWILTPAFVLFFTSWAYSTIAHGYLKHE